RHGPRDFANNATFPHGADGHEDLTTQKSLKSTFAERGPGGFKWLVAKSEWEHTQRTASWAVTPLTLAAQANWAAFSRAWALPCGRVARTVSAAEAGNCDAASANKGLFPDTHRAIRLSGIGG